MLFKNCMNTTPLNENDQKLLAFCMNKKRSVNETARELNVQPASVVVRIKKLLKFGLIEYESRGRGNKSFVRTKSGIKTDKYMINLLKKIRDKDGEISEQEFDLLLSFDYEDLEGSHAFDKIGAKYELLKQNLVKRKIVLTEKGKELLNKKI